MAFNHPLLAMLSTHLFTFWVSHMGCTWIESCVFAFAILHLSRSFPVKLRLRDKWDLHAGHHVWSTWSCDIWTRLSYIIQEFFFRQGGGRIFDIKITILKKLGKFRKKMKNWRIPDILATFHRQKRRQNVFAYLPREEVSVRSQATAVSRALSSEHNKSDPEISKRQTIYKQMSA